MVQVNVHEAKTHLSRLLRRMLTGEEIVISRAGKPIGKLVPYEERPADRRAGQDSGMLEIPADFDAPLPREELEKFER